MNSFITSIGVMQGRLLPKYKGRYQAHPLGYWQDEFPIAASLQFDYIEFILDYNDASLNPLMTASGLKELQELSASTNVGVRSVCADYFMEAPLHHSDKNMADTSLGVLKQLMHNYKIKKTKAGEDAERIKQFKQEFTGTGRVWQDMRRGGVQRADMHA